MQAYATSCVRSQVGRPGPGSRTTDRGVHGWRWLRRTRYSVFDCTVCSNSSLFHLAMIGIWLTKWVVKCREREMRFASARALCISLIRDSRLAGYNVHGRTKYCDWLKRKKSEAVYRYQNIVELKGSKNASVRFAIFTRAMLCVGYARSLLSQRVWMSVRRRGCLYD